MPAGLPKHFCWTRFGTEAGETIDAILRRKEQERTQNGGIFLWGIGNALGPSMRELLRREAHPEVVFSPIRSAPKAADASPASVLAWAAGRGLDGGLAVLPKWSVVTSRAPVDIRAARHYALVCYAETRLRIDPTPPMFAMGCLENLLTQKHVGASQVTAIVRSREISPPPGPSYAVALRVHLAPPYFLELTEPRLTGRAGHSRASLLGAGGLSSH